MISFNGANFFGYKGKTLQDPEETVAISNMLSLLLESQKHTEAELNNAIFDFQNKFPRNSVKVLFLRELIFHCEQKKDFYLIRKGIEYFTNENVHSTGRKIALRWLLLFEELEPDIQRLGKACSVFNQCFTKLQSGETNKRITVICRNDERQPLSLLSLLTYELFQKQLDINTEWIPLENTALTVVKVFEKYLDGGDVSKHAFVDRDPHPWAELFDMGRMISDEGLQRRCLFHLQDQYPGFYLKNALEDAFAEGFKDHLELKKDNYKRAIKIRTSDYLSHEWLGKQLMKEKDFSTAWFHFSHAAKLAPFRPDLGLLTLQALMEYGKQLRNKFQNFCKDAARIRKMIQLEEDVIEECEWLFQALTEWSKRIGIEEPSFKKETLLSSGIQALLSQVNRKIFSFFEDIETDLRKYSRYPKNHMNYEGIQVLLLWLKGDLLWEKGKTEEAKKIYNELRNKPLDKEERAKLFLTLAKCHTKDKSMEFLSQGLELDPKNETIQREMILLDAEKALSLGSEFLKQYPEDAEVRYAFAVALFHQGKKKEAMGHFLECDPYSAHAYYNLGEIEGSASHFKTALTLSREEPLERSLCLKMANYFLKKETEEKVLIELVDLILKLPQQERPWEIKYVLNLLEKKIPKGKIKDLPKKGPLIKIQSPVKPISSEPLKGPPLELDDTYILLLDNQGEKEHYRYSLGEQI